MGNISKAIAPRAIEFPARTNAPMPDGLRAGRWDLLKRHTETFDLAI
jgi:hypothetical protein